MDEDQMKIVVCGDSFCSADRNRPGTHFSELLLQHTVINLARGGISNIGIGFQLEQAIKLEPDYVIFSSTSSDRIDVPVKNKKFDRNIGLKNFIYPYQCDASYGNEYVGGLDSVIMSDVMINFLNPRPDLPETLVDVVDMKEYLTNFYDPDFKEVIDSWIIGYWKYNLTSSSIPYIHLYDGGPVGQAMYLYTKNNPKSTSQCVYHTDENTQLQVAEELIKILNQTGE